MGPKHFREVEASEIWLDWTKRRVSVFLVEDTEYRVLLRTSYSL